MKRYFVFVLILSLVACVALAGNYQINKWNGKHRDTANDVTVLETNAIIHGTNTFTTTAVTDTLKAATLGVANFGATPIAVVCWSDTTDADTVGLWVLSASSSTIILERTSGLPSGAGYNYHIHP